MTTLASPVGVPILENSAPWPGPPTFRVTSTFAQHVASGRGAGIDIGNGRCGAPVVAMAAGTVTFAGQLSTAIGLANVVRYRISATEELGAAHLATMTVANGQKVAVGQQIGTLGMTGADACHLHQGYKVSGVEKDWWPLYQQQEAEVITAVKAEDWLPTANAAGASNGVLRGSPDKAAPIVARIPLGTSVRSIAEVTTSAPSDNNWRLTEYQSKPAFMLRRDWQPKVAGGDPAVDAAFNAFLAGQTTGVPPAEVDAKVKAGKHEAATAVAAASITEANRYPA